MTKKRDIERYTKLSNRLVSLVDNADDMLKAYIVGHLGALIEHLKQKHGLVVK